MEPKPPPTSGAMTRTLCSGMPSTKAHMSSRCTCGFCEVTHSVSSPVASSKRATQARGSMALATSRWLTMRFFTVTAAPLKAASVAAASPSSHLKATLPGAPSCTCGGAGRGGAARCRSPTAAAPSRPRTFSAASMAAAWLSAMTTATGSPTWRAASLAERHVRDHREVLHDARDVLLLAQVPAARQRVDAGHVLAGEDRHHARMLLGRRGVDLADPGVRVRAAHERRVGHARAASRRRRSCLAR